ncbi:flagellar motor switch protein FliN [Salinisphaera aquimarina]|uniref:Flagellar motor switch protein FliN n=1 Tax=Salinisphaera aquimarina TaxID=2094031 RepID=A0ABV7EN91_9GAMM
MTDSKSSTGDEQKVSDDDWAAAMGEQASTTPGADETETAWAEAMTEQKSDTGAAPDKSAPDRAVAGQATSAEARVFQPLQGDDDNTAPRELDMIMDIPVTLSVELGQTRLSISELLDLAKGSIVELDGLAGEPMDILINGYLIAQGEVVVVDDKYGIRITEIVTRAERINKLNR